MPKKEIPTPTAIAKAEDSSIDLKPKLLALRKKAESLLKKWTDFEVKTAEDFESAGLATKDFVALRKELKEITSPAIKAAKVAYDTAKKLPNDVDSIIEQGEVALRETLIIYQDKHRKAAEAKVEKAIARGDDVKAASIAAKPFIPEVSGLSFTERWHGEIADLGVFLTAIIDGRIPTEAVEPNLVWLNAQARAAKREDLGIPGAKGVCETSSSVRT